MATKKGMVMTAIILAAISAASFFVWIIPQDTSLNMSISDFGNHIDGVENIHRILSEELDGSFDMLQRGEITAAEYGEVAETTSTQINSQIIQLVESKATEEWHQSYISYIEALKTQNTIIRETIVAANAMEERGQADVDASLQSIEGLRADMESLIAASQQGRP